MMEVLAAAGEEDAMVMVVVGLLFAAAFCFVACLA
jgi:hypothetical protein